MRLVMVCDLPVPGGPSSTKSMPSAAARTAANWLESALMGVSISATGKVSSRRSAAGISGCALTPAPPPGTW